MAVGGLVVTFTEDPAQRAAARAVLEHDPRIEVGPADGLRLAVVAETDDARSGEKLCAELLRHPGIVSVDLAYVGGLDDDLPRSEENER